MRRLHLIYYAFVIFDLRMSESFKRSDVYCRKVLRRPSFDPELVVGKTWKVYFTWETLNASMCLYLEFKSASDKMVNEIRSKTEHMLALQPDWDANGLLLYLGRRNNENLLFSDVTVPGKFVGFPTLIHVNEIDRPKKKTHLIRLNMKLLYHGQYLLLSYCDTGITLLASHKDPPPSPQEIERLVAPMKYGDLCGSCFK